MRCPWRHLTIVLSPNVYPPIPPHPTPHTPRQSFRGALPLFELFGPERLNTLLWLWALALHWWVVIPPAWTSPGHARPGTLTAPPASVPFLPLALSLSPFLSLPLSLSL